MATMKDVRSATTIQGESLKEWAAEWKRLSDEEKAEFKELVDAAH